MASQKASSTRETPEAGAVEGWIQKPGGMRLNIAGIAHNNRDYSSRQAIIRRLKRTSDKSLRLIREPSNAGDRNAVAIVSTLGVIGYLTARDARDIAKRIDFGESRFSAEVYDVEAFKTNRGKWLLGVVIDVKEWVVSSARGTSQNPPLPNVGELPYQLSIVNAVIYWIKVTVAIGLMLVVGFIALCVVMMLVNSSAGK